MTNEWDICETDLAVWKGQEEDNYRNCFLNEYKIFEVIGKGKSIFAKIIECIFIAIL